MTVRIYMGGIKTGQVTTGLHHTMRLKALQHVFGMEMSAGYPDSAPVSNNNYFRCVRDNTNSGKKYPYLMVESSGVTIVSRDASGGTDPSVLFASGETPDTSGAMNKVALSFRLKIPVVMVKLGRKQKRHAKEKGVAGVYLLSVRCI